MQPDSGANPPPPLLTPMTPRRQEWPNPHESRDFRIGVIVGLIPLVLALIGTGANFHYVGVGNTLLLAGVISFLAGLVIMIVLVSIRRTRRIGQGLLTALAADLVIVVVGCLVILRTLY
jgi:hypothetical protein